MEITDKRRQRKRRKITERETEEGKERVRRGEEKGRKGEGVSEKESREWSAYTSMSVTYDRRYFRTIGRDNARRAVT